MQRERGRGKPREREVERGASLRTLRRVAARGGWPECRAAAGGAPGGAARTLLAAVDELASVRALRRRPLNIHLLVVVAVGELDLGDGGATAGVVDDVLCGERKARRSVSGAIEGCGRRWPPLALGRRAATLTPPRPSRLRPLSNMESRLHFQELTWEGTPISPASERRLLS